MLYGWRQTGSHWGVYCVCAEAEASFRSICLEKVIVREIARRLRTTNLNRGFVPMQTFPHLDSNPIEEFQRESGMILEVSPVLCIPMAVENPNGNNRVLDALVCLGFQVLGGMHICA